MSSTLVDECYLAEKPLWGLSTKSQSSRKKLMLDVTAVKKCKVDEKIPF